MMMSATALRISALQQQQQQYQKAVLRVKDVVTKRITSSTSSSSSTSNISPSSIVAMTVPGLQRHLQTPLRSIVQRHFTTTTTSPASHLTKEEVWKRNIARLYARRILELAALLAATKRYGSSAHAAAMNEEKITIPDNWKDWEYRDWSDDLLQSLGNTKLQRFFYSTRRILSLGILATPMVILYPLSFISTTAHNLSWDYALWGIEKAGPTFIKLVQWATTRQDLFTPEFCLHFGKLRDETIGHSWRETQKILAEEIGTNYHDIIDIQEQPIGSGCIAQVYHGKLKSSTNKYPKNTEIAIKIQHPGIWHKVCVDFYILAKIANLLESIPKLNLQYLSLADTVRQFRDIMLPQLDLRIEAKNLQRFNVDFSSDDNVTFPYPIHELTSSRVLTETFIHGTPIMEFTKAPVETRRKIARIGLTTTLNMIFLKDFIHGDLHPGNILVSEKPDGSPRLHFLDCGLVVEVGPHQHVNMIKILGAFTRKDGQLAGQLMVDTSSGSQASDDEVDIFINGIVQICKMDDDNNFIEKVGDYIADICYLACRNRVKLEATFVNAALAVEIMEGIAAALYPDMHVQPIALPLIVKAEMMHRLPKIWN